MRKKKSTAPEPQPKPQDESQSEDAPFFAEATEAIDSSRALAASQEWAQAVAALRPLAEQVPGAIDLWLQIAQWERQDGQPDAALSTLQRAIELNQARPDNLAALWHALASHHFETQDWPLAAQTALEGIALARAAVQSGVRADPSAQSEPAPGWAEGSTPRAMRLREHELLELLATARAHEGRFEEAGQAMRALLTLSPRDPLHRMRLGSLLQSHGALGEASREFERVLELAPGTFFARDAEAALELLDKAQIQQILTRAGEQRSFGLHLERDLEGTLDSHAFYLSESGRESLRQMIDDGRPDLSRAPRIQ